MATDTAAPKPPCPMHGCKIPEHQRPATAALRDWPCSSADHLGLCSDDHVHADHVAKDMALYDQGAVDALRSLAESFADEGMQQAAEITFRAAALVEDGKHLG